MSSMATASYVPDLYAGATPSSNDNPWQRGCRDCERFISLCQLPCPKHCAANGLRLEHPKLSKHCKEKTDVSVITGVAHAIMYQNEDAYNSDMYDLCPAHADQDEKMKHETMLANAHQEWLEQQTRVKEQIERQREAEKLERRRQSQRNVNEYANAVAANGSWNANSTADVYNANARNAYSARPQQTATQHHSYNQQLGSYLPCELATNAAVPHGPLNSHADHIFNGPFATSMQRTNDYRKTSSPMRIGESPESNAYRAPQSKMPGNRGQGVYFDPARGLPPVFGPPPGVSRGVGIEFNGGRVEMGKEHGERLIEEKHEMARKEANHNSMGRKKGPGGPRGGHR